jgi:hypothetical protein
MVAGGGASREIEGISAMTGRFPYTTRASGLLLFGLHQRNGPKILWIAKHWARRRTPKG